VRADQIVSLSTYDWRIWETSRRRAFAIHSFSFAITEHCSAAKEKPVSVLYGICMIRSDVLRSTFALLWFLASEIREVYHSLISIYLHRLLF
jgi:hypothetical protein